MKSMYDFAMASKISAIRIAAIEKGKCMPTKIELKRFCKALDCKVEILMMLSTTLKNVPKRKHFLFKTLMPNMKKMTWEILKMKKMTWEILKQK
jgi:transcriptional regulator with XRE-family HTH domain